MRIPVASHCWLSLIFSVILILAILVGVGGIHRGLTCLMSHDIEQIFIRSLAPWMSTSVKGLFQSFAHFFFKLGYLSIPCSFVRVFNTFWIRVFCLNVSSPNSWLAFLPFYSLDHQKFLILMKFSLSIFFPSVVRTFCVLLNKSWSWPIPRSWRYLHIYFSRSFIVQWGIILSTCTF